MIGKNLQYAGPSRASDEEWDEKSLSNLPENGKTPRTRPTGQALPGARPRHGKVLAGTEQRFLAEALAGQCDRRLPQLVPVTHPNPAPGGWRGCEPA